MQCASRTNQDGVKPCCRGIVPACEHATHLRFVMTKASMPGLMKVGCTKDLEARVWKLSSATGVPTPFVIAWAYQVASPAIEGLTHERLAWCRVNGRREFSDATW